MRRSCGGRGGRSRRGVEACIGLWDFVKKLMPPDEQKERVCGAGELRERVCGAGELRYGGELPWESLHGGDALCVGGTKDGCLAI